MRNPTADDLTTIELLVLADAGGGNDLSNAYGAVQLHAVFDRESELLDAVEGAVMRLFDLGLIRIVQASPEAGYHVDHDELPAMSRDGLLAELARERDPTDVHRELMIFYDTTLDGDALLKSVPEGRIPRVSGTVHRPWQK